MEDYGESKKKYSTIISGNGKSRRSISSNDMPADHKEACVKRRSMPSVVDPDIEEKSAIMWRKSVIQSKMKTQTFSLSYNENFQVCQMMMCVLLIGLS